MNLLAIDIDVACMRSPEDQIRQSIQALEKGCLATPGWSENGKDLIGPDGEINLPQSGEFPIGKMKIFVFSAMGPAPPQFPHIAQ